jgi:hypothetical protein
LGSILSVISAGQICLPLLCLNIVNIHSSGLSPYSAPAWNKKFWVNLLNSPYKVYSATAPAQNGAGSFLEPLKEHLEIVNNSNQDQRIIKLLRRVLQISFKFESNLGYDLGNQMGFLGEKTKCKKFGCMYTFESRSGAAVLVYNFTFTCYFSNFLSLK